MPKFPTARSLGKEESVEKTELVYSGIGTALATLGFNLDFAPVCDIDSNPKNPVIGDRSFSDTAEKVIAHSGAAMTGLSGSKILACAKHFPGHGDTIVDSHLDLPADPRPISRFYDTELQPFIAAIANKVDFIMTAHVVYKVFDDKYPATLSKKIVTDLLRDELEYEGVIIGDDLDMKAVCDRYSDEDAARLTFLAGADMALVCHESARREKAWEAVREAIDKGKISEERLSKTLARIMDAKGSCDDSEGA
jgi:beta-N-acetylhexosaminidase